MPILRSPGTDPRGLGSRPPDRSKETRAMTQPQLDADALFDSRDGRALLKDAIGELRAHARRCASVVMAPDLRDIIPDHIQADILQQSYDVMDCVGRLTAMLL